MKTVIKPAYKGGATVIINRYKYIHNGMRQLCNQEYYSPPKEYPTRKFNAKILDIMKQATNLNIIDAKMQKYLQQIPWNTQTLHASKDS